MSTEQRRHKRVPFRSSIMAGFVTCPPRPELVGSGVEGFSTDISEGGMRLETRATLPLDSEVRIDITVLEKPFRLGGIVVWSGAAGTDLAYSGIRFSTGDDWSWKIQVARAFASHNQPGET